MTFAEEINNYTDEELDIIISTQKDLYSRDEMAQLQALKAERTHIKQEAYIAMVLARLPETINCEKCDGPNPFSNNVCDYCGHKLNKDKYYTDEYYEQSADKNPPEEVNNSGNSYTFHYIISFLIPFIGFIVGAIMLANDDSEKSSCGKACIIIGIISMIISSVFIGAFWL